jgi:ATP synthase protein I
MSADRRFPGWVRYSGIGLELAGATAGLALVGYWIDGRFGTAPWGILGGVVIGLIGGLYNLVRESLDAVREAKIEDRDASQDDSGPSGPGANGN